MAASGSQVVPSEYFDSVFDRSRHLDQFEVFHRDSSERAEFVYPTRSFEYELHERPEASTIHFNRQVEIRVRASGPARATTENVECEYFWRRSCPLAEDIARKLLQDRGVLPNTCLRISVRCRMPERRCTNCSKSSNFSSSPLHVVVVNFAPSDSGGSDWKMFTVISAQPGFDMTEVAGLLRGQRQDRIYDAMNYRNCWFREVTYIARRQPNKLPGQTIQANSSALASKVMSDENRESLQRQMTLRMELWPEVGDGVKWNRRRIVGVFEPPLLQQRSDTPCPTIASSS
jgi:hypothetical protein